MGKFYSNEINVTTQSDFLIWNGIELFYWIDGLFKLNNFLRSADLIFLKKKQLFSATEMHVM